jgi:hypothetical protein
MAIVLVWLGLYPQPVLNTFRPALEVLQESVTEAPEIVRR